MTTITPEQQQAIANIVTTMTLSEGLGTAKNACSIAAINLALTGVLTDEIPPCMSEVIGEWIIRVQDEMPAELRNSAEWKELLPLAAGTGRQHEKERLAIILDWMWGTVLPTLQFTADANGFGNEWRLMIKERTVDVTCAAAKVAARHAAYAANCCYYATATAVAAAYVDAATAAAADAARHAAYAADAAYAAYAAADAARHAAYAAAYAANDSRSSDSIWDQFDPPGLLRKLIQVGVNP